jgi:hypothetical protein
VVKRMGEQKSEEDYAKFLDHIRTQIVENVQAPLVGRDAIEAVPDPEMVARVSQSLLISGGACQAGLQ